MEIISKFKTVGFALALGTFMFACDQNTGTGTNDEAVETVEGDLDEAHMEARRTYDDFDAWVTTNSERAETVTADEFREMRTEYNRRESELERESANWDEATRREWEETKNEWNDFENKVQERLGNIEDVDVDVDANVERENN
ncbi:hypothetical protein [Pontibacter actiniarum]|uniref:Uncharacterized protein n=1 Tax=Pontibacter actiniarum TaxID=323450 RepID=A0A1X9YMJ2_9BACT|nr:hypothetical protein [Pontibacter actiniarum]ARS34071.1 hypothetical protein CA264_00685 [Pontibacter actiniarum]